MNKDLEHKAVGLTQDELKDAVRDSGQSVANKEIQNKLDNCDLSQPAIELIQENDLKAVFDIASGVNKAYPVAKSASVIKNIIIGSAGALIIVLIGLLNWSGEEPKSTENLNPKKNTQEVVVVNTGIDSILVEKEVALESENEIPVSITPSEQKNNSKLVGKSEIKDTIIEKVEVEKIVVVEESEDEVVLSKPKPDYEVLPAKAPRRVLGVIVSSTLDNKFKGDSYSVSDLVHYEGGKDRLQEDIFALLKDEIKDTDVPKSSSTVVFNFEVSSRGKIKEVSVQSRITPELETQIEEKVKTLSNWRKGGKRVAMTYSVFVTFK